MRFVAVVNMSSKYQAGQGIKVVGPSNCFCTFVVFSQTFTQSTCSLLRENRRRHMAIIGAHMLLYSSEADALRAMFRDVFGFESVDAGGGWLIFALPPSELGVHPAEGPTYQSGVRHQVAFMCDDIRRTIAELRARGV